jgi:hypothetical protein
MGTTLTGTTPQDTYDSLIKVTDNGPISGTAKYLSDGLGNDSALALSTGNVGIGTNAPTFKFQVNSAATATAMFRSSDTGTVVGIDNSAADGDPQLKFFINDIGTFTLGVDDSDSDKFKIGTSDLTTNTRLTIDSNGNVGIGTSAPAEKLEIAADADPKIRFLDTGNLDAKVGIVGSTALGFEVNSAERARITSDGYLRLAGGGIQFNGDTAAANALDDYEEGTFTPTIIGTTTAGTATYGGGQSGLYTKIGRMVYVSIYLSYSGGTGTGDLRIAGLPFTIAAADVPSFSIGAMSDIVLTALNVPVVSGVQSATQLSIQQLPVGGGTQTSVTYDGTGVIVMSGFYQV